MSWLPKLPPRPALERMRPWRPPTLANANVDVVRLTYIVIDEMVGDQIRLSLEPWPYADDIGRLRFPPKRPGDSAIVNRASFCALLGDCGHQLLPEPPDPKAEHRRHLRIGDVFAAVLDKKDLEAAPAHPKRWLLGPSLRPHGRCS